MQEPLTIILKLHLRMDTGAIRSKSFMTVLCYRGKGVLDIGTVKGVQEFITKYVLVRVHYYQTKNIALFMK